MGSNIGDRMGYINDAIEALKETGCSIIQKSRCFESESWGFQSEWFINLGVQLSTHLSAHEFLKLTQDIERKGGRRKKSKNGYDARTLDIDIIFFNEQIIETPDLTIPHPRMHERRFVLEPLNDIIPGYKHPVLSKNTNTLLNECVDNGLVRPFSTYSGIN